MLSTAVGYFRILCHRVSSYTNKRNNCARGQLQDEKKRLQEENDGLASETAGLKRDVDELKVRLDETEWGLCQKSGELAHVKSQLKDARVSTAENAIVRSGDVIRSFLFSERTRGQQPRSDSAEIPSPGPVAKARVQRTPLSRRTQNDGLSGKMRRQ